MKDETEKIISRHGAVHGTLRSYTTGFILSILFTLAPYFIVVNHLLSGWSLGLALAGFAVVQLIVQLVFFLHLGSESSPRWNLIVFLFMLLVLVTVVFGSLWIMSNLNYHQMTPQETESYIEEEEAIKRENY